MKAPAPPKSAVDWMRASAIPVRAAVAGSGFTDMEPIRKIVGTARIASLGEATHGTREFFQFKHRMLEFLVEEMGFGLFGIEASFPECLAINDYVMNGVGEPSVALTNQRFWTWDTEEVLDLIKWMRRYNRNRPEGQKIKFYGFDMQFPTLAVIKAVEYLGSVDARSAKIAERSLRPLSDDFFSFNYSNLSSAVKDETRAGLRETIALLTQNRDRYIRRSSMQAWWTARQCLEVARQGERLLGSKRSYEIRDLSMARNVRAILRYEGPKAKIVLWAHNGHVQRVPWAGGTTPMGLHLHKMYGKEQVVFGFSFNRGRFQAISADGGGLRMFEIKGSPAASLDSAMSKTGHRLAVLSLRKVPRGPVRNWLAKPILTKSIGAVFSYGWKPEWFSLQTSPLRLYDAVIFVEKTTRARPNLSGHRTRPGARSSRRKRASGPQNLDLVLGVRGKDPPGWNFSGGFGRGAYSIRLEGTRAARILEISRESSPWRWGSGGATQTFDASTYRGGKVVFTATLRVRTKGAGNSANMFINATKPKTGDSLWAPVPVAAFACLHDNAGKVSGWRRHSVEVVIPKSADQIAIGFSLAGNGRMQAKGIQFRAISGD